MAFKSIKKIEEDKFSNLLRLDDEKSINGVFLYKSVDDVLVAAAHYINSKDYHGYVHCCESGCPACKKGIRVQNKLFIPIFVPAQLNPDYEEDTVIFWDRNQTFYNKQLKKDVFDKYDNPTSIVFKITRHGEYRDINTTYSIIPKANFCSDIDEVLENLGVSLPEYYENIIRTVDAATLSDMLNEASGTEDDAFSPSQNYSYQAKPRKKFTDPEDISVETLPGEPVSTFEPDVIAVDHDLETFSVDVKAQRPMPDAKSEVSKFDEASLDMASEDDEDGEPTF